MSARRRKESKRNIRRRKAKPRTPVRRTLISRIFRSVKKQKHIEDVPHKPITGRRLWLFRIAALIVIPFLLFLLLELGLRIAGYGFPADAIIKHKADGRVSCCDNVKFCWRFFPKEIAREFNPFSFSADKSEDTYRIFVLGASAAQGEPDGAFGFGRILQLILRDKYPGVNFEVIIAATAAINSHVVVEIAKDCARYEPDLFVVYLGNNEVTGPYGAGTVFAPLLPSLSVIRTGIAVRATRLGQLLTSLAEWAGAQKGKPTTWRGLEMFLEKQIRADDKNLEVVYQHFHRNLEDIAKIGHNAGAKIIVSTVGSNLKDNPPFASLHRTDLTKEEKAKWDNLYTQAVRYESDGKYTEAVESYLEAADIDGDYADLQFRLGRCYWAMGEYEKGRERYVQARELDTLRFRADKRINKIVRSIAGSQADKAVYMVDAVKVFEENSLHETPGEELFYEHVHLNLKGNYLLAKAVFNQVEEVLPQRVKVRRAESSQPLTQAECAQRLAYTQWDQYVIADEVLGRFIKKPPFTNQLYHEEQIKIMEKERDALKADITPETLKKVAAQYGWAIQNSPQDVFLRWKYGTFLVKELKDYRNAAQQFRLVRDSVPYSYVAYSALGSVLEAAGDFNTAITNYQNAIRIKPTCGDVYYSLGWIYQRQGRTKKAMECYYKAMRFLPGHESTYNNLAHILYQQGKVDEAIEICHKGLVFLPNSPVLHSNLGLLLNKQGHRGEAIKELNISLELDPNSAATRGMLESVLKNSPD